MDQEKHNQQTKTLRKDENLHRVRVKVRVDTRDLRVGTPHEGAALQRDKR